MYHSIIIVLVDVVTVHVVIVYLLATCCAIDVITI